MTGTILFQDDFATNGRLNAANWDFNRWEPVNNPSYLGLTQMRQERPFAENGMARIRVDTYLDGKAFSGSEAITTQKWDVSTGGLAFEGKFKFEGTQGGMIAGFFTYQFFPPKADRNIHDEIDYEILTTNLARISTNVFAHEPLDRTAHPSSLPLYPDTLPANFFSEFHTYRMEWTPSAVRWLLDGVQIRIETNHVPTQPSQLHMNLWGVPGGWGPSPGDPNGPRVGDPSFVPATRPGDNKTYFFDVAQVKVERLASALGSAAADSLVGGATGDTIDGGAGNDSMNGLAGDDTFIGGAGSDAIDGGDGTDTAVFSGLRSDYAVTRAGAVTTIADARASGPDGTDSLTNVERAQFADGLYAIGPGGVLTMVPQSIASAPASTELVVFGDAYTILKGQPLTTTLQGSVLLNDIADGSLTASLFQGPTHGTVQLQADGTFTYTPTAGFSGIDSFDYKATDSHGAFGVQTALIQVVPTAGGALDLAALTPEQSIATMYTGYFGRGADADGFGYWVQEYWNGVFAQGPGASITGIAGAFGSSAEAKGLHPFLANPNGASDAQIGTFINEVYDNLFNRAADAAGQTYWLGQIKQMLNAGQAPGAVMAKIIGGAQNAGGSPDITTLMNKVAVNVEYAFQQVVYETTWSHEHDGAAATALIGDVTSDVQSVLLGIRQADLLVIADAP